MVWVEVINLCVLFSVLCILFDGIVIDIGLIFYVFNFYFEEDGVKLVDFFFLVCKEGEYLSWEMVFKICFQNEDKSGKVIVVFVFKSQLVKDFSWCKEMIYVDVILFVNFVQFDILEFDCVLVCDVVCKLVCFFWDYEMNFYICDFFDFIKCNQEFVCDIMFYWNSGCWVIDISLLFVVLCEKVVNGKVCFVYWMVQFYKVMMNLCFQNKGNVLIFVWVVLFKFGGVFGDGVYNIWQVLVIFECLVWVKKVEFLMLVMGYGFNDFKSCVEFCNIVYYVIVNGNDFMLSSLVIDNLLGCFEQVKDGVVFNQFGIWVYGCNNWCFGQGVKLWNSDFSVVVIGFGFYILIYKVLVDGQDYLFKFEDGVECDVSIYMISWLVYYVECGVVLLSKLNVKQQIDWLLVGLVWYFFLVECILLGVVMFSCFVFFICFSKLVSFIGIKILD